MNDPNVFVKPEPGEDRGAIDWKVVAPRWVVVSVACASLATCAVLGALLIAEKNDDLEAVKKAQAEAPSAYQIRQESRITVLEVEVDLIKAQNLRYNTAIEKSNDIMGRLTMQLEGIAAEMRRQANQRARD